MDFYYIFFIAFATSFLTVPLIMFVAHNSGAIALPGRRHIHTHPTPKLGGVAIAAGVLLVTPLIFPVNKVVGSYLASSALMLLLGIIDDIRGTNWKIKLLFSIVATSIIMAGTGMWIRSLGDVFGFGEIQLGYLGIPFTYFAVFGVINAINLIDGLNGLACGVSSIAFLSYAVFASISGNENVFYLSLACLGATLGLFRYNYPKAKIFMGDSGSMFLGFSLAVQAILLTQGRGTEIRPMVPVIILGFPIFDTLRVLVIRILNRRHPFEADKTHLHHLMIRSGIYPNHVVKTIWVVSALMSILAFALYRLDGWVMSLVYGIFVALLGIYVENLGIIKLNRTKKIIPPDPGME
ncbi:MAG: undecaprenyl/decaprenyl-phosphate alpha-N-acetylglucosaminyl 1-phosphate transferase [Nitrospiraceae bacterium]|nr:MAG: undecaprenyl/decaprenyl-phosphate alpha-N-acetylglucosaminyl 1-phosphate transferase [Nitrospiraceae bacterium]